MNSTVLPPPPPPSLPPWNPWTPPPLINNSDSPLFDSFDDMTKPSTFPCDADEYQSFHGGFPALPSAKATILAPDCTTTICIPSIMDKEPPTEEISPNCSSLPAAGSSSPASNHTLDLPTCEDALSKHRRRALLCESKRRALMNSLFLSLRSTIPDLASVTDKCNVIDRTCDYMKGLERELVFLRKKSRVLSSLSGDSTEYAGCVGQASHSSGSGPDDAPFIRKKDYCKTLHPCVHVIYCGNSFSLNIEIGCWEHNGSGLFPSLLYILESNDLEVLSANRSQRVQAVLYMLHVKASRPLQRRDIKTLRCQLYARVSKMMSASDA